MTQNSSTAFEQLAHQVEELATINRHYREALAQALIETPDHPQRAVIEALDAHTARLEAALLHAVSDARTPGQDSPQEYIEAYREACSHSKAAVLFRPPSVA